MRSTRLSIALLIATGLLAGCGKANHTASPLATTPGSTPTSDQALVTTAIAASPQAIEDGLADSNLDVTLDGTASGPSGVFAAIQPLNFWRRIDHVERTFDIEFSDNDANGRPTTAIVTIHKKLTGTFNILTGTPGTDVTPPAEPTVIHKPLEDHWTRRVMLKRLRVAGEDEDAEWHVVAISGVQVTSKDAVTSIKSVRIQTVDQDTTIVDPLAFRRLRQVLRVASGTQVKLTVTTGANDDVVVLYHRDQRFRFHNNGDFTYTGTWTTGLPMPGLLHVGINALSHGTLFDDQAPYDSQAWIFPYSVAPETLAEFMP